MKRFLISRLSALGDVVCSLPAATALKTAYPESEIVWAVDKRFAGIVECCAAVDKVEIVKPGLHPSSWPKMSGEFDAAFDLQGLFKSAILLRGLKCPRFGYHWQREFAGLFSQPVTPDPTSFHIVDQYVDVVRAFGVQSDVADFALAPKQEDQEGIPTEPYVVINPGAAWVTKRWPAAHSAAVVDWLHARRIESVLIGGPSENDQQGSRAVFDLCKHEPLNFTGRTSVRQLVALLARARAHVGSDTGSTHIAAALGVPAVGLYSLTRPQRSCPYGQIENCIYESKGLAEIAPERAIEVLERVLQPQ